MKRPIAQLARLALVGLGLGLTAACRPSSSEWLDPAQPDLLENLLDQADICPEGYNLVEITNVIRAMGMTNNPGFIRNISELEAMARYGGTMPFLAVYGTGSQVGMMVNGVFFYDRDRMNDFIKDQKKQSRLRIAVYDKPVDHGYWAIICAVDPKRVYTPDEQAAINAALARKSSYLETQLHFSRLWDESN